MYLIDTNIFLEILLDQKRALECVALLEKIKKGDVRGFITSFSLHSIEVILSRYKKTSTLEIFLEDLLSYSGLEIIETSVVEELRAVKAMFNSNLDFDDSLQYHIAKAKGLKLISFDQDFDKTELKRLEPKAII